MIAGLAFLLMAMPTPTPPPAPEENVLIDGNAAQGAMTVNVAAGNANQQANVGLVAIGEDSRTGAIVAQAGTSVLASAGSHVELAAGAFAGSRGWVALSASAGNGNQHANIAAFSIGIGARAISEIELDQSRAPTGPAGGPDIATDPQRSIRVGDAALADSRGLVQVSLVGGDGNTSANSFALTFESGASTSGN